MGSIAGTVFRMAREADLEAIGELRHEIYARELGQHAVNAATKLADPPDQRTEYIVAAQGGRVQGFVGITPPESPRYAVDKYLERSALPFPLDSRLFEIRILTLRREMRGTGLAALLMNAALRWIECRGGGRVVALGRSDILRLYIRVGLRPHGITIRAGRVEFELMSAPSTVIRSRVTACFEKVLLRCRPAIEWRLDMPFLPVDGCRHGGDSVRGIGERFEHLDRRHAIINADVLDAWFPPAPGVLQALSNDPSWFARTSPPVHCTGMLEVLAETRSIPVSSIVPGAGSSDLIYRAFRHWLNSSSRVLIPDPAYGEYAHVLERVVGCRVDRFRLRPEDNYVPDLDEWKRCVQRDYDLAVLVNPGNPAGGHVPRDLLEPVLQAAPASTRVWVDEAYVDYVGERESLEGSAVGSPNLFVCKSMSKVYALSGMRVAYLVGPGPDIEELRRWTPPWVVGLPSQLAAVRALEDPSYYRGRYVETGKLRGELTERLGRLPGVAIQVQESAANHILCRLPQGGGTAAELSRECRMLGLYLRDLTGLSRSFGGGTFRIAVKDRETNTRIGAILEQVLTGSLSGRDHHRLIPTQ